MYSNYSNMVIGGETVKNHVILACCDFGTINTMIPLMDNKIKEGLGNSYDDSEVKQLISEVNSKVDSIEQYDDTAVKSRIDKLESINHNQFLKYSLLT